MMRSMRPIVRKLMRLGAGAVGLVLALGVVVHLPLIKHWLGAHGHHGAGVCPLGYSAQAPHVAIAPPTDGKARPALGFQLGVTTAAELERWGAIHGVHCHADHHGTAIACDDVPSALLGDAAAPPATLMFALDAASAIRSLHVTRRAPHVQSIATAFDDLSHALATTQGPPSKRSGSAAPAELSRGALRQAMVEYRGTDYLAVLRATNMGDGFVLTEQYALLD